MVVNNDDILTSGEVAKLLHVSRSWILDHASGRRQPALPGFQCGKLWRFSRLRVQEWIEQQMSAAAGRRAA